MLCQLASKIQVLFFIPLLGANVVRFEYGNLKLFFEGKFIWGFGVKIENGGYLRQRFNIFIIVMALWKSSPISLVSLLLLHC